MLHRPQLILVAALLFAAASVSASGKQNTGPNNAPLTQPGHRALGKLDALDQRIRERLAQAPAQGQSSPRSSTSGSPQQKQQPTYGQQQPSSSSSSSPTVDLLNLQYPHSPQVQSPHFASESDSFSLPPVTRAAHLHTAFMLTGPYKDSVLAADHAIDYVVGFLTAYSHRFAMSEKERNQLAPLMNNYLHAIGVLIEFIEKRGYAGMDNKLAVVSIQTRVAALKIDLLGLHTLARTIPGLSFEKVQHYVDEGDLHAKTQKEQQGWLAGLKQSVTETTGFLSKWRPRTREEVLAYHQQLEVREKKVLEQHDLLNRKTEPDLPVQQPQFSAHDGFLHPQPVQYQQKGFTPDQDPFAAGNHHFNPVYQDPNFPQQPQYFAHQQSPYYDQFSPYQFGHPADSHQQQHQGFGTFVQQPQQGFGHFIPQPQQTTLQQQQTNLQQQGQQGDAAK